MLLDHAAIAAAPGRSNHKHRARAGVTQMLSTLGPTIDSATLVLPSSSLFET